MRHVSSLNNFLLNSLILLTFLAAPLEVAHRSCVAHSRNLALTSLSSSGPADEGAHPHGRVSTSPPFVRSSSFISILPYNYLISQHPKHCGIQGRGNSPPDFTRIIWVQLINGFNVRGSIFLGLIWGHSNLRVIKRCRMSKTCDFGTVWLSSRVGGSRREWISRYVRRRLACNCRIGPY